MTKNKQNYMNNPNLPAVGAEFEYTSTQIKHLQKAAKNLLYFAENFFYIILSNTDRCSKKRGQCTNECDNKHRGR